MTTLTKAKTLGPFKKSKSTLNKLLPPSQSNSKTSKDSKNKSFKLTLDPNVKLLNQLTGVGKMKLSTRVTVRKQGWFIILPRWFKRRFITSGVLSK